MTDADVPSTPQTIQILAAPIAESKRLPDRRRHFEAQVDDATLMLDYAISSGIAGSGKKVDDDLIKKIQRAQDLASQPEPTEANERAEFEAAYRDLALLVSPVTAETLKATSGDFPVRSMPFTGWTGDPVCIIWSRKLSTWAIIFVAIAIGGSWFDRVNPDLAETIQAASTANTTLSLPQLAQVLLQTLVPFTYGRSEQAFIC